MNSQNWCVFEDISISNVASNSLRMDLFTPDTSKGVLDRSSSMNYRYSRVPTKPLELSPRASLKISSLSVKKVEDCIFVNISPLRNSSDSYFVLILEENEEGLFFLVVNAFEHNNIRFLRFGEKGLSIEN